MQNKMSTLRICRICLRTEAKGYKFDQYQLKYFYEEVTAQKIPDNDELPQWFCYECATILHKFHKFKEKCYNGQKCMKEMLRKGPITYEAIYKLDRAARYVKSTLERFIISDRVKTFTIKGKDLGNTGKLQDSDKETKFHIKTENCDQNSSCVITEDLSDLANINNSADNIKKTLNEEYLTNFHQNHKIRYQKNHENYYINNENHNSKDEDLKNIENHDKPSNKNSLCSDNDTICTENMLNNPTSPISILVAEDKIVIPKHNNLMKSKTKNLELSITVSEFGKILNEKQWKKIVLTEDEALKEFRTKAENSKYLAAAFKCTDCFKGFSKKNMLNRHLQSRHSEELGAHECRFCRMRFKWLCHLRRHTQQHYTKYQCLLCHACFNMDSSALVHEECHSGATRACGHCGQQFRHVTTYYTHMRTHRSAHVCVTCGASFVSENGLLLHTKRKHLEDTMVSPSSDDDDDEGGMYCARCDIRFRSQRAYTEHLFHSDMHTELITEEPDDSTPPKKIMGKKLREKITKQLGKRMSDSETLSPVKVKRRKTKTKKWHIKPSTCYQCGEHFSTQAAYLKHHVATHPKTSFHAPNQRHICELCGASLAPGSVALHQNMHSREIVYKCEICGREFYSKISLQRHIRTHTGEKPFPCPLCNKRFTQSNSMKLHYRTFHLKQPYPKRNRNKKYLPQPTEQGDTVESDNVSQQEPTPAAPPEARPPDPLDKHLQDNMGFGDENMHYLTLS